MKIYTKTGDDGTTGLFGGQRVKKYATRIDAYGTVDELNAVIGIARSCVVDSKTDKMLDRIQNDLFAVGADLATPLEVKNDLIKRIGEPHCEKLENWIDEVETRLTGLKKFILPGGSTPGAYLHLARTICRRAERLTVKLTDEETVNSGIAIYLNRLSDLLFVLARLVNYEMKNPEAIWKTD